MWPLPCACSRSGGHSKLMASFAEKLKQAKAQRLPNGKTYAEASHDDWRECLDVHHALGRSVRKPGGGFTCER